MNPQGFEPSYSRRGCGRVPLNSNPEKEPFGFRLQRPAPTDSGRTHLKHQAIRFQTIRAAPAAPLRNALIQVPTRAAKGRSKSEAHDAEAGPGAAGVPNQYSGGTRLKTPAELLKLRLCDLQRKHWHRGHARAEDHFSASDENFESQAAGVRRGGRRSVAGP
jgi:hypothetical protein